MRAGRTIALLASLAVTACALAPQPPRDDVTKQALPNVRPPTQWAAPGAAVGGVADNWLATFRDPQLDALVIEAVAYNADLRIAAARVDAAAAYLAGVESPLWPQVNAVARGGGKMSGDSSGLRGIGCSRRGSSTCGDACARSCARPSFRMRRRSSTPITRGSRSPRWSRRAGSSPSKRGCKGRRLEATLQASEQLAVLARDRFRIGSGDEYDIATAQATVETLARHRAHARPRVHECAARA
jgi:outer membrane protein TolC